MICPACGHDDDAPAGLILYAGGPGAVRQADMSEAAVRARKRTPSVRDAPDPVEPPTARTAGGTGARRQTAAQRTQVAAWQRKAGAK